MNIAKLFTCVAIIHPFFGYGQESATPRPKAERIVVTKTQPGLLPAESFSSWTGQPAAAVIFRDLQGKEWSTSALIGKVVYLNFWFTGCAPCVKEIPALNALHAKLSSNPDLIMLSLAYDDESKLRDFLKRSPITFPVACISFEVLKKLAMPTSSIGFPTHIIIDREGNLLIASTGGSEQVSKDLEYSLTQALKK